MATYTIEYQWADDNRSWWHNHSSFGIKETFESPSDAQKSCADMLDQTHGMGRQTRNKNNPDKEGLSLLFRTRITKHDLTHMMSMKSEKWVAA